ncbi:MAG: hypothetical protein OQK82_06010 [Candidatus Pacearchaeota archaeon]|nr:hypothetical protein [Candidatus Pacearchaeota archaeon]
MNNNEIRELLVKEKKLENACRCHGRYFESYKELQKYRESLSEIFKEDGQSVLAARVDRRSLKSEMNHYLDISYLQADELDVGYGEIKNNLRKALEIAVKYGFDEDEVRNTCDRVQKMYNRRLKQMENGR